MAEGAIPILEMKNAGKTYSQNGRAIEALRGASLRVKKGEFVCLIGASGCGKSTLLRMAAGFEAATHGDVLMWGMPISGPGPEPRHGLSGLRFVSLAQRPRQYRLRPEVEGPDQGRNPRDDGSFHRTHRSAELRRRLSAPAFGRHEAARCHCPRAGQRCRNRADGRTVRRARCDDPRAAAGRTGRDLVADRPDRHFRYPLDRGSDLSGRSGRGDVARTGPHRQ